MKILVRHSWTGLYLANDGTWADHPEARAFPTIDEAGAEAWKHEGADVILSYDEPRCELALNPVYCAQKITTPQYLRAA